MGQEEWQEDFEEEKECDKEVSMIFGAWAWANV